MLSPMRVSPQTDQQMMRLAIRQARIAYESDEVPIGAVIAIGEHILAQSHNQVELLKDPTAHAEMLAITQATATLGGKYLSQATLYVTVEPCPMCMGASYMVQKIPSVATKAIQMISPTVRQLSWEVSVRRSVVPSWYLTLARSVNALQRANYISPSSAIIPFSIALSNH